MRNIYTIIRLIRLPNLIIIAGVLYLQRLCIVQPLLWTLGINPGWTGYGLIVLGTVLIAAAGYLINDYFDIGIDAVNTPAKAAVLKSIPHHSIKKSYFVLALTGLAIIALACILTGAFLLWFVYLIATLVLFWYSSRLKKVLILGNIAIAMASAFTMPAAWLFDWLVLSGQYSMNPEVSGIYYSISMRVIIYSLFAFLISFAREIIKDTEDMEGDSRFGCRSIPVIFGAAVAKRTIVACFALTLIMLCVWQVYSLNVDRSGLTLYLAIAVDLPLLWLITMVFRMHTKTEYHQAGHMSKVIMVTGILSMLFFLF